MIDSGFCKPTSSDDYFNLILIMMKMITIMKLPNTMKMTMMNITTMMMMMDHQWWWYHGVGDGHYDCDEIEADDQN